MASAFGSIRLRRVGNRVSTEAALSRVAPSLRFHNAYETAMTPPAIAAITRANIKAEGPIHAPAAAHSLRSPRPMVRSQHRPPSMRQASATAAALRASAAAPQIAAFTTMPPARNGSVSQLGIRRHRRSAIAARTTSTKTGQLEIGFIVISPKEGGL